MIGTTTIAIDPGTMSGVAAHTNDGYKDRWWTSELAPMDTLEWLERALQSPRWNVFGGAEPWPPAGQVVCERFSITQRTLRVSRAGSLDAFDVIGGARYLCWKHGVPFTLQDPGDAKAFATDDKLRRLGLGVRDHAADAMRHLVLALVRSGELSASLLV